MNAKRFFSIVLAIVLVVSCISFSASAEEQTATISLKGEAHAVCGAEYKLSLNVAESEIDLVGGFSCDIIYNAEMFTLKRAEVASDFAKANYIEANGYSELIREEAGKITVALLDVKSDQKDNKWITFVFDVLNEEGNTTFAIENASVSNADGTDLITCDLNVDITDETVVMYNPQTNMNGASIKKDVIDENGNIVGNLRFEAQLDSSVDKSTIKEIGFVMLPAACLDNGELTITESGKYTMANGKQVSIAYNGKSIDSLNDLDGRYYCYLTNTMEFPLTMAFAARPYVKLNDGTCVYGYNEIIENNIVSGTSEKSCIDTAKAIYAEYVEKYPSYDFSAVADIVELDASEWTTENYQTVVNALVDAENSAS
ncbi:MAG: hypothetical protein IJZ63_02850 [Clostridia bacterium]|nr:hypothetical protein [Clostridia bacterium]